MSKDGGTTLIGPELNGLNVDVITNGDPIKLDSCHAPTAKQILNEDANEACNKYKQNTRCTMKSLIPDKSKDCHIEENGLIQSSNGIHDESINELSSFPSKAGLAENVKLMKESVSEKVKLKVLLQSPLCNTDEMVQSATGNDDYFSDNDGYASDHSSKGKWKDCHIQLNEI